MSFIIRVSIVFTISITLVLIYSGFVLIPAHASISGESSHAGSNPAAPVQPEKGTTEICLLEQHLIEQGLVNVRTLDPTIKVNLKYAHGDNFMGENVYGDLTCAYLRPEAAAKLVKANQILRQRHPHLCIQVLDAVRPRSVQHKMWNLVVGTPMQNYVANPYSGSMHNYGAAVDVTLFDVVKGEQLDMGTPIDFFGPLAQPRLENDFFHKGELCEIQLGNRRILRNAMCEAGWHVLQIEWWHFNAFPRDHIRQHYTIIE